MPANRKPLWERDLENDLALNFDPNTYARELLDGAEGLTDEEKAALSTALTKDSVAKRLRNSVALRAEAQRRMDEAREVAREALDVRQQNYDWLERNRQPFEEWANSQSGRRTVTAPSGDTITKVEMLDLLRKQEERFAETIKGVRDEIDEQYLGVLTDSMKLMNDWNAEFPGEPYPYADLKAFALDHKMSLENAFPLYVGPKRAERQKAEVERIRKTAYDEGHAAGLAAREEVSTIDRGGEVGSAFKDVLLGRRSAMRLTDGDGKALEGENAFVERWNRTQGFTRPETGESH